jgi:general secretion pathway protein A
MYLRHFGLEKNPFLLNTTANCVYFSASHCEASAQLLYAMREPNGIVLIDGEAGTGKTTMLHSVLGLVRPAGVVASLILTPLAATPQELVYAVLAGFDINIGRKPPMELLRALFGFLVERSHMDHRVLLVVDEAQMLTHPLLECLRLISDLEYRGCKVIQVVLSGHPELRETIADSKHTALRQRIVARCHLRRLQPDEVWNYLALRIARAGGDGRMLFEPEAVDVIAGASSCIPRLVNVLADNCLIAAYSKRENGVNAALARIVASHFDLVVGEAPAGTALRGQSNGERSAESWKSLVEEYRTYQLPETLRLFAETLKPAAMV